MPKTTWVLGCLNPKHLELLLRWLPEEQWDSIKQMVVLTGTNIPVYDELRRLADLRPGWDIDVRVEPNCNGELDYEHGVYAQHLMPGWPEMLAEYPLRVMVLYPLLVPEGPVLWTDDDFVVVNDPGPLLGNTSWGGRGGLDMLTPSPRTTRILDLLDRTFELDGLDLETYNVGRTSGGCTYLTDVDRKEWETKLRYFFEDDVVRELHGREGHKRRFINGFRTLDQRFVTGWMMSHNGGVITGPHYRIWPYVKVPKKGPRDDGTFYHYCAGKQKPRYVEWLHKVADERGIAPLETV